MAREIKDPIATLISIGIGVAFLYCLLGLLFPGRPQIDFRLSRGQVPVYFSLAAVIVVLVLPGQVLELRSRDRTGGAVRDLPNLSPARTIQLRDDGTEQTVSLEIMASGDAAPAAEGVIAKPPIASVRNGMLPEAKATPNSNLQAEGNLVALAGDGIKEARALSLADVDIALCSGPVIVMESAEITLIKSDSQTRQISLRTPRNIYQNIFFTLFYNGIGVLILAGALYRLTGL